MKRRVRAACEKDSFAHGDLLGRHFIFLMVKLRDDSHPYVDTV